MAQSSNSIPNLTSGRLLARNTIWNLATQILPIVAGLAAVPALLHGMGTARFGLLSLVWIVIGYFSLFDLGIGRALTKLVADKLGANESHSIPPLAWTSLLLLLLLGALSGVVTLASSRWLVYRVLNVPEGLQVEALQSFRWLALSIPVVTVTSGLRGILEAQQRFGILSMIRIPMGVFSFAGPLLVLPFSHSLVPVVGVLLAGRLAGCAAHLAACLHAMPNLRYGLVPKASLALPVLRVGGWMTVSNLVGPLMSYVDRFLIGTLLSVNAVAYYTAPFDMANRITIVPMSIMGVLFPALALNLGEGSSRASLLVNRGIKYIFLAIFPLVLVIVTLAPELLRAWLGNSFAENSTVALRWLLAGVLLNSLGYVPFTLIQSAGRPDITAKVHLVELPLYLAGLYVLVQGYGIAGAAMAWTGRVALDAVLLSFCAGRLLPEVSGSLLKRASVLVVALLILYLGAFPGSIAVRLTLLALGLLGFGLAIWFWGFDSNEKVFLFGFWREASGERL